MQCSVMSAAIVGVKAVPVEVEVVVSSGMPGMSIVGMPDTAVQEARERVRAAVRSCGFSMPAEKIVVNLAPSSLRKTGSGFDLPIAAGILAATGQISPSSVRGRVLAGELSLEGRVRPVTGLLAYEVCAREAGLSVVCSSECHDAVPLDGLEVHLDGQETAAPGAGVDERVVDLGSAIPADNFVCCHFKSSCNRSRAPTFSSVSRMPEATVAKYSSANGSFCSGKGHMTRLTAAVSSASDFA